MGQRVKKLLVVLAGLFVVNLVVSGISESGKKSHVQPEGHGSGNHGAARQSESVAKSSSVELGAASGYWQDWKQTETPSECDTKKCFYNRYGPNLDGVPFIIKGFSTELDFDGFKALTEDIGGREISVSGGSLLKIVPPYWEGKGYTGRNGDYPCCKVFQHREKVAFAFDDENFTLAGLPVKYAFYNYVEATTPATDPSEKETHMYRYIKLAMLGTEGDAEIIANALNAKFRATRGASHDPRYGYYWGFYPLEQRPAREAYWDAAVNAREEYVWLILTQRDTHTRLPEINADVSDL